MKLLKRILLIDMPILSAIAAAMTAAMMFQYERDLKEVIQFVDNNANVASGNIKVQQVFNREIAKAVDRLELLYDQTTLSNNENFANLMEGKHVINLRPVRFSRKPARESGSK